MSEKVFDPGILEEFFESGMTTLLDFVLVHQPFEYTISDLSKFTDLSTHDIQRLVDKLVEYDIMKSSQIDNNIVYTITDSNTTQSIKDTLNEISFKRYDIESN